MGANTEQFTEAFSLIVSIAEQDGVKAINQFPGCWERDLADGWAFSVNGKSIELADKRGVTVPVYRAAIYHSDNFLGFVDPYGGALVAGVEDELIAALKASLETL